MEMVENDRDALRLNVMRLPLQQLIENSGERKTVHNFTGEIKDLEALKQALPSLRRSFPPPFIYFAFDEDLDEGMTKYCRGRAIEADTSDDILALYHAYVPGLKRPVDQSLHPGVAIRGHYSHAYESVRELFPQPKMLVFPGVLVGDTFLPGGEMVFISTSAYKLPEEVRQFVQCLLGCVRSVRSEGSFPISSFCGALRKSEIKYDKSHPVSATEVFTQIWMFCRKHGGTLTTVISKFV
ncbi:MAG: hypothetical protein B7Z37_20795 [Verrucomicrobia bacterium 12-59-8]|nr:MAG: hypothetical protein B7Z37_20795 [Verrucomicrobia bacterium 12-59-8]